MSKNKRLEAQGSTKKIWATSSIIVLLALFLITTISAGSGTGGTITTSGAYTIHTFTSNGTFTWTGSGTNISFLMVGAGGTGGNDGAGSGGGGGGGGYIFNQSANITAGAYAIVIGAPRANNSGTNTSFNFTTLQAAGGGRGGYYTASDAGAGGSGGGGGQTGAGGTGLAGANISGQGYIGGAGGTQTGGGGGACNPGVDGVAGTAGTGGNGCYNSINGTNVTWAGGGAGKGNSGGANGVGGTGGGANIGSAGLTNRGGGGAGGGEGTNNTVGGSGIFIVRYLTNNEGINIHLVTPINNTNTSTTNNSFTTNVINGSTGIAVTNVSLYINGTINQTNTSQMNGSYTFYVPLNVGLWNWTVVAYGNDSIQYNASNGTFNLNVKKIVFGNQSYNNATIEQTSNTFKVNFSLNSGYSISSTNFTYNQTNYSASFAAVNSTYYQATYTLTAPPVNLNTVILFNWSVFLTDGTTQTSTVTNQTVLNLGVDNCSTNTIMIYNFTIKNEATQVNLTNSTDNTSIKVDINFYPNASLTTPTITFSHDYNQTHPARVCISAALGSSIFYVNAQVQYDADGYELEFYNIQNYSLNSTSNPSQNISLYDLATSQSTTFTIIYKDSSYLPVQGALIQVQRKYVDEGVSKVVEIPMTDINGQAVAHLVIGDVIYTFTVVKNGEVLATFTSQNAVCQNPTITDCVINLNSFLSSIDITDFEQALDFSYSLGYTTATRTVSSTFSIPSGGVSWVSLNVTQNDVLGTSVCSSSTTTSAGTLNCVIGSSFGNSTVTASIYKDGVLIARTSFKLDQTPSDIYSGSMVLLALFAILTLIGASMSDNPVFTIIFFALGVLLLIAMNFVNLTIGAGASVLWLIVAIIIVIIKGSNRG